MIETGWIGFLRMGFLHVFPWGYDHVLFVLCIFFSATKPGPILLRCTAFTVAHSLTLALVAFGMIVAAPSVVEPLIAFSILIAALENIYLKTPAVLKLTVVFLFGLVHGMGFASALKEAGIPEQQLPTALISFNVGVELGQLTVIGLAWVLVGRTFARKPWYRDRIVYPASVVIGCIAVYWTISRLAA